MSAPAPALLRWITLVVGLIAIVGALVLDASAADVLLTLGATIGLASLLFWLEQQWEKRADEIEQRTDVQLVRLGTDLSALRSTVLEQLQSTASTVVEANANSDRRLINEYLSEPSPAGLQALLSRLYELRLDRPTMGQPYATSVDPESLPAQTDPRLGYLEFAPVGKGDTGAFNVSVRQRLSGGSHIPRPPSPVQVEWVGEMSVSDLMSRLLETELPARGHLWTGSEQFAAALAAAVEHAGQVLFDAIAQQSHGRPAVHDER